MAPDPDPRKRPSRRAWPINTRPTTTPAGTHDHRMPGWVLVSIIGLGVTVFLLLGVVALVVHRSQQLTAYRNEQQARTHEEMRQGFCDLLDQFPPSPLLDGPRHRYHCGPGIPVEQLPPSVRQQWHAPTTAAPAAPTVAAPRPTPSPTTRPATPTAPVGAQPDRTVTPEPPPSPRPPDSPPPPAPPTSPLDPLLCGLLPTVCQEAS